MSNFSLKILALIFMTIDHVGYFLPNGSTEYIITRSIGRLAFPIFLFLIIEGYTHTSNVKKYMRNLYIFALISALPFKYAFGSYFDVFFTLGTVILMLEVLKMNTHKTYDILILVVFTIISIPFDWGAPAIVTVYFSRNYFGNAKKLAVHLPIILFLATTLSFSLFWGILNTIANFNLVYYFLVPILFSIPILYSYNGERGPKLVGIRKYFFYLYYPIHLVVIAYFMK